MKTEAEITTLLLASAALGRERGDTTALEQALADSLKLERDRADRAVAEATGAEYVYLLTIHDLREELEAALADKAIIERLRAVLRWADLEHTHRGAEAAQKLTDAMGALQPGDLDA